MEKGVSRAEHTQRLNIATRMVKSDVHYITEELALHTRLPQAVGDTEGNISVNLRVITKA